MKKLLIYIFFLQVFFLNSVFSLAQGDSNQSNLRNPQTDEDALVALYNATDGDNWTDNTNWLSAEPLGDWYGITTDGDGYVTDIDLYNNNLVGFIPPELGNLLNLQFLRFGNNQLEGSIPMQIGNLNNLTYLDLGTNQLSENIPAVLGNLLNLQELYLPFNQLSGTIPPELGNLSNLQYFSLSSNQLSGSIPPELGYLVNLKEIVLNSNQFSGDIPPELGNMTSLESLALSWNNLSGNIPANLSNLDNLTGLYIRSNSLTGTIPSDLGNLVNLEGFAIDNNSFTGSIPPEIGNLTNLTNIYIHDNNLDSIPINLFNLNLEYSKFYNNLFTFEELENMPVGSEENNYTPQKQIPLGNPVINLENGEEETYTLPFDGNVTGSTYNWYRDGGFYQSTNNNSLTVSDNDGGTHYYYVEITNSSFPDLTLQTDNLTVISNNSSSNAEEEALIALYNATDGDNWTNNTNWLSEEPLGDWYGVITDIDGNIIEINLADNQLNGSIPSEIGDLQNLEQLILHINQLNGNLTSEIGLLQNIVYLNLAENQFEGPIPASFGNLQNIVLLHLNKNSISGNIPTEFGSLINLEQLDLSENQLTGYIPSEIGGLYSLTSLYLNHNQLSGIIPSEIYTLESLGALSLGNNSIGGTISSEISNLSNLGLFMVNDNIMYGDIPSELGDLVGMETIWVHNNMFDNIQSNMDNLDLDNSRFELNYFTYEDLENLLQAGDVDINPQNTISIYDTTYLEAGIQGTIQLDFDNDITNSTYNWFRQGSFVATTNENSLSVTEEYGGTFYYSLEITNTDFSGFTLEVDSVIVIVEGEANPNIEEEALIALYNATDGDNWFNNTNWLSDEPLGDWYGVTTNGDGNVVEIDLGNNELIGYIPFEIGDLQNLTYLDFSSNMLSGEIPTEIGDLQLLTHLSLPSNQLSGHMPIELTNLSEVTYFNLSMNNLTGSIPEEINQLSSVTDLYLNNNQMTGEIPNEIGQLQNLVSLELSNNQFGGEIPYEIGNLISVIQLFFSSNQLTGTIPESIGELENLTDIWVDNNMLIGAIPSNIGDLLNIENFILSYNFLDEIPISFTDFTTENCHVDNNYLTYEDIQNLPNIAIQYDPQRNIPLYDTIYLELGVEGNIQLSIDDNVVNSTYNWYRDEVYVGTTTTNFLATTEPTEGTFIYSLEISNTDYPLCNIFIDSVIVIAQEETYPNIEEEALIALYNATDGDNWTNNTNWLSEETLENWYGITTDLDGNVLEIQLNNNNLNGIIPTEIGDLSNLNHIYMADNMLSGPIPESIGNLIELNTIYIASNQLSGSLPESMGNLSNLVELLLYENNLSGSIPNQIGNLFSVETIVLESNNLSGQIPETIGNLENLVFLSLSNNQLSGNIPETIGSLEALEGLKLENNQLQGAIPTSIGSLTNLVSLIIGDNNLEGTLPESIVNLINLEDFNISNNRLSGGIPAGLSNISPFEVFQINNNNFSIFPSDLSTIILNSDGNAKFNNFTFEDLFNFPASLFYNPQNTIPAYDTTYLQTGVEGTILLDFDNDIINSTYNWYRQGIFIESTAENNLILIEENSGVFYYSLEITNTDFSGITLEVDSIIIIVSNCGLSIFPEVTNISCNGGNNGQISINAVGGVPPYLYSIDNGNTYQSENIFSDLSIGIYDIMVHDDNDCYESLQIEILEPENALILDINSSDVSCFEGEDGSIEVSASGGDEPYYYSSNGGTSFQVSNVFTDLVAGDYQVQFKDANNCILGQEVIINQPSSLPYVSFTELDEFYCNNIEIVNLTGNHAPLGSFSGQGITDHGNGTATMNPSTMITGGPYTITYHYTDEMGCYNFSEQSIMIYAGPTADFSYSLESCADSAHFIDQSTSPNGIINTWAWDFDDLDSEEANHSALQNPKHRFISNQSQFYVELIIHDVIGCYDTSLQLIEPFPLASISGSVTTDNGLTISNGYVLAYLLSEGVISTKVDSVLINNDGSFEFLNIATCVDYIFHAYADIDDYPEVMPRWHLDAFYWFDALSVTLDWDDVSINNVDVVLFEIDPIPNGSSSVNGGVYYYDAKGEPVKNIDIVLEYEDNEDKAPIDFIKTNELGRWEFDRLIEGQYQILVDIPGLIMDSVYTVTISEPNTQIQGLNYYLDPELGIFAEVTGIEEMENMTFGSIGVFPNPNTGSFHFEIIKSQHINRLDIESVELFDMYGRLVKNLGIQFRGQHLISSVNLNDIDPGMYFLKVKNENEFGIVKLVIQR